MKGVGEQAQASVHKYTSSPGHSNPKGRKQGSGPVPASRKTHSCASSSSQLPELSLEKHFGFLERKALRKYRELGWKVPLFIIWRMSVVFEGNHSSFKAKTMAKNNRGAAGSQRNTKVLSIPKPQAVQPLCGTRERPWSLQPLHTHSRMSPVRHRKQATSRDLPEGSHSPPCSLPRGISPTVD